MRLLLLVLTIAIVSCASDSAKKSASSSTVEKQQEEEKKVVKEEPKKSIVAKKEVSSSKNKVTCRYGEIERILENKSVDGGGCEVLYTKNGETNSIANAKNELDYCQEIMDRVTGKLADAGYKCDN